MPAKPIAKSVNERTPSDWTETIHLGDRLQQCLEEAPNWGGVHSCHRVSQSFFERTYAMQQRLEKPLVVAFLGGTGTGKSALINALVGQEVAATGKERPTTERPRLLCRREWHPRQWGFDLEELEIHPTDAPVLKQLVLIDCPDPDTTENEAMRQSNLSRLRAILPLCDVLVVTGTQQKYRSRRVSDELADAAPGARLIFVQTNADRDEDIRDDWRRVLEERYAPGKIFLVDSLAALRHRREGRTAGKEFERLYRLLTEELTDEMALKIRHSNYVDLAAETIDRCWEFVEEEHPAVRTLKVKIEHERKTLGTLLCDRMRRELLQDRRYWENRLVSRVASHWGYSPFAVVLRSFQWLSSVTTGWRFWKGRTLPQWAVMGAYGSEGKEKKGHAPGHRVDPTTHRAAARCWEDGQVRESALILAGFTQDAKMPIEGCRSEKVLEEASLAAEAFAAEVSGEMDRLCDQLALSRSQWKRRVVYETLLSAMLLFLIARPAKNFFIDSWLQNPPHPLLGIDFYLVSLFWLLLWASLLLGVFTWELRRGLDRHINDMASHWKYAEALRFLFSELEGQIDRVERFTDQLQQLRQRVERMHRQAEELDPLLGRRLEKPTR
jgi:hypothetical protein